MSAGARTARIAEEVRLVVSDVLVRQEIKEPAVWNAGIITVSHVKVTGDLRQARVSFMVHGAARAKLVEVRDALNRAAGFVRHRLRERLRVKLIPAVEFVIDEVYASEERVDRVLRELEATAAHPPALGEGSAPLGEAGTPPGEPDGEA